jgi:type II secretory pathway pseudopilin PulG
MNNRKALTLIELLTVLVIIIVLLGIFLPSIATVRKMAKETAQRAQFATMDMALEAFKQDYGSYPNSGAYDDTNQLYCGAMKLAEAMVGKDLKGFNLSSVFRRDGFNAIGDTNLYPVNPGTGDPVAYANYVANIKARRMYIQPEKIGVNRLGDIYTSTHIATSPIGSFQWNTADLGIFVLCDVFARKMKTGNKTGMPILYYRADTSKVEHGWPTLGNNTYSYHDNVGIVDIPLPWCALPEQWPQHPMARAGLTILRVSADPIIFYDETLDKKTGNSPHNASTYILMSAGADGQYGTSDDIFNGF